MNILIEIPTWLGDAVMATPAIENILKKYPDAELTIFGSYVATRIFLYHPNVKNIIVDASKKDGNRYINLYKYAKSIKNIDIAISFRKNFTTKFFMFFLDAKEKYIYKRLDREFKTHQVIRYNDFVNKSFQENTKPAKLKIYTKKKQTIHKTLTLGINPGATYGSAKRWYPEEFAKVAIELAPQYNIKIFGSTWRKRYCK